MVGKIYPVGFTAEGADERVTELMSAPATMLIDIRLAPRSRMHPEWNRNIVQKKFGSRYAWHGDTLGNKNANRVGQPIELVDPAPGVAALVRMLQEGTSLVMLCPCRAYDQWCVCKTICELIQQSLPEAEIVLS